MKRLGQIAICLAALCALTTVSDAALKGGDVDPTFNIDSAVPGTIHSITVQPDGKEIIGGEFDLSIWSNPVTRNIARLNVDGSLDNSFVTGMYGANGEVDASALQPDGRVLIAGQFTSVNGVARRGIARLNADGSLDTSFQDGLDGVVTIDPLFHQVSKGFVYHIALQPDGRVLLAGTFNSVNGVARTNLARLNPDGSTDTVFLSSLSGNYIALQSDGKVLVTAGLVSLNGTNRFRIARMNSNGSADISFQSVPIVNSARGICFPTSLALQADGKALVFGLFDTVNGVTRHKIARLNTDGSLDSTFQNGMAGIPLDGGNIFAVAVQPDGKTLVGGDFSAINGMTRGGVARLNPDGSVDANFQNGMTGVTPGGVYPVLSISAQGDGMVLMAGQFTAVNGVARNGIARLYGTAPLLLTNFGVISDHYGFDLTGESNAVAVLEVSTNFVDWAALATNTIGAAALSFRDPASVSSSQRFYRARFQ